MAVRLSADIALADTEYGVVLLDKRRGRYWGLNGTGALALETLLAGGTEAQAAEAIARRYPVDVTTAKADIAALLQELQAEELIES